MNKFSAIVPEFVKNCLSNVTRLETINHTKCDKCHGAGAVHIEGQDGALECPDCHGSGMPGRNVVFFDQNKQIDLELQDDGRTLKIFIKERDKA